MTVTNTKSTRARATWTPQVVAQTFHRGIAHLKRLFSPEAPARSQAPSVSSVTGGEESRPSEVAFASTSPATPPVGSSKSRRESSPSAPPPSLDTWARRDGPTPSDLDEIERAEAAFDGLDSPSQTSFYPERESIDPDQEGPDSIGRKMAQRMLENATGGVPDSFR